MLCYAIIISMVTAYLFYWIFILPLNFQHGAKSFFLIDSTTQVALWLISNICNVTALVVFYRTKSIRDQQKYLFMFLIIADILQITFLVPSKIFKHLMFISKPMYNTYYEIYHLLTSLSWSASAMFTFCLTMVCLTRFFLTLRRKTEDLKLTQKMIVVFMAIHLAFIGGLNYRYFLKRWDNLLITILAFFVPSIITLISLTLDYLLQKYKANYKHTRKEISQKTLYGVFGTLVLMLSPSYIMIIIKTYCCDIETSYALTFTHIQSCLELLKCSTTPVIFSIFDQKFRYYFLNLLTRCCCGNTSVVNNEDQSSIMYSVTGQQISIHDGEINDNTEQNDCEQLIV